MHIFFYLTNNIILPPNSNKQANKIFQLFMNRDYLQIVCSTKKKNTKQFATIWIRHLQSLLDINFRNLLLLRTLFSTLILSDTYVQSNPLYYSYNIVSTLSVFPDLDPIFLENLLNYFNYFSKHQTVPINPFGKKFRIFLFVFASYLFLLFI